MYAATDNLAGAGGANTKNSISMRINNGAKVMTRNNAITGATQIDALARMGLLIYPRVGASLNLTSSAVQEGYFGYIAKPTTDATADFEITQPYGRGALTAVVPDETTTTMYNFWARTVGIVANGPFGATCINRFQDRLFAFGGSRLTTVINGGTWFKPLYGNIIQWSTGNVDEWPRSNFAFIDDAADSFIIGAGTVGSVQVVFTPTRAYLWSGYDESSFQLDDFQRGIGCVDGRSVKNIEDRLYWMSHDGLYSWPGNGPLTQETHPNSAVGINTDVLRNAPLSLECSALGRVGRNRIVMSCQLANPQGVGRPAYVFHTPSRSWAQWSVGDYNAATLANTPYWFIEYDERVFAVGQWQIWRIDQLWNDPPASFQVPLTAIKFQDEVASSGAANSSVEIGGRIQFRDFVTRPGRTTRVREIQVDHASQYTGGAAKDSGTIQVGVDADPSTLDTASAIPARVTATSPPYDIGKYFTDRVMSIDVNEGAVLRFVWNKPSTAGYTNDGGNKLFRIFAKIQVTRNSRVDPTAT